MSPSEASGALVHIALREMGERGKSAVVVHPILVSLLFFHGDLSERLGGLFWAVAGLILLASLGRWASGRELAAGPLRRLPLMAKLYGVCSVATSTGWGLMTAAAMAYFGLESLAVLMLVASSAVAAGALGTFPQRPVLLHLYIWTVTAPIIAATYIFWVELPGWVLIAFGTLLFSGFLSLMGHRQSRDYWDRVFANQRLREQSAALVEARRHAEAAGRAKGDFLASMSHEIRTPLNGVLGIADLLEHTDLDAEQTELVETLMLSGKRLLRILDDILDFSSVEAGHLELDPVDVDPASCVEDAAELVSGVAEAKELELEVRLGPGLPRVVRADSGRIQQVLLNLAGNAVKFTEQGRVRLQVDCLGIVDDTARIRFCVEDTGPGIPEEKQAGLFSPFTQGDGSIRRKHGGSGLGLAICRRLVNLMGGEMGFSSTPGQGTSFWFELPVPVRKPPRVPTLAGQGLFAVVGSRPGPRQSIVQMLDIMGIPGKAYDRLDDLELAVDGMVFDVDDPRGPIMQDALRAVRQGHAVTVVVRVSMRAQVRAALTLGSTDLPLGQGGEPMIVTRPLRRSRLKGLRGGAAPARPKRTPVVSTVSTDAGPKVLVVEDNPVNQMLARRFLERAGYLVTVVQDGLQGVDAVASETWDLVLMDCQMPNMDGIEATRRIRATEAGTGRHLPIVAMTAHALATDRNRALDAGMDDYLTKPLDPKQMERVLAELIAAP